ncbi:MAG: hypothetical protein K5829_03835 [Treponema sp.]|nr:hypothetical protein [Treponema sp.]
MKKWWTHELSYEYKGLTINLVYCSKDMKATYESPYGTIEYYRHIMYSCPWIFTEEQIRNEKFSEAGEYFLKILTFLKLHPNFIDNAKAEYKARLKPVEEELAAMRQKKAEQKALFKVGKVSEQEYAVICKELKHKKEDLWLVKSELFNELWKLTNEDLNGIEKLIFD